MKERIKFTRKTTVSDGAGGTLPGAKVVIKELWASVRSLTGARFLDQQIENKIQYEITIRYQHSFTPDASMTVEFRGMDLTIHGKLDVRPREKKIIFIAYG